MDTADTSNSSSGYESNDCNAENSTYVWRVRRISHSGLDSQILEGFCGFFSIFTTITTVISVKTEVESRETNTIQRQIIILKFGFI